MKKAQKKKLKILVFNRWVGYNEGGNETHIKELAYFLSRRGHKISILTTGRKALRDLEPYLEHIYEISSPKSYYSLEGNRLRNTISSFWFLIKSFLKLSKILLVDKEKFDVLSVHFSLEAFLARFIRFFYGIPYILVLVGDTDFELVEGKYADITIQISNFMADECKKFGYKPYVLTKGVDRKRFNTEVPRSERKNFLKDVKREKLVVTVCRLDPRKNIETLIKAAEITNKTAPEIKYLIVGGGTEEKKLRKLVRKLNLENVVFMVGPIPSTSNRLPKLFRAGDIFALPTLYEGFGYVYSEAMGCGLPIVTTNIEATREVVGKDGLLVPLKNPEALAQAIIELASDSSLRDKLIKAGSKKVEQWYWDNLIAKYERKYIKTALAKPGRISRVATFLRGFGSLGFLIQKTASFIIRPQYLKWGPSSK